MNPSIASLIYWCGIIGLFYLDRNKADRTSKALWLPIVYLWILGSRPVSFWLGVPPPAGSNVQLDGSPFDAAIFGILLLGAIVVLVQRGMRTRRFLTANWPIFAYFLYCLISVAWSSHPDVAFKRWIKAIDDPAMCLIVITDRQPIEALKRLISRVGFVLLPTSLLLIKYYGDLGRGYTPDGVPMNTGVTTNKNLLGVVVLVISLCTLWHVISLLRSKGQPNRWRHLLAQGSLLAFGVSLFNLADSQTSIACFILGGGLILATGMRSIRNQPARVHLLCLLIFITGGLTLFLGGGSNVAQGLGRKSNLSGRTDIWAALIQASPNAIVGAGFESFWMSPNADQARHTLEVEGWWHPELLINEAHDGYLEIYLNLGVVGLGLISLILISGYMRAVAGFRRSPSVSGLMMAYIIIFAFYNITEAGFRTVGTSWVFLLLAIFSASGITSGRLVDDAFRPRNLKPGPITATTAPKKLMPQGKAICTTLTPIACGTCSDS